MVPLELEKHCVPELLPTGRMLASSGLLDPSSFRSKISLRNTGGCSRNIFHNV